MQLKPFDNYLWYTHERHSATGFPDIDMWCRRWQCPPKLEALYVLSYLHHLQWFMKWESVRSYVKTRECSEQVRRARKYVLT